MRSSTGTTGICAGRASPFTARKGRGILWKPDSPGVEWGARGDAVAKRHTGLVVGKDFRPPEGAEPLDWCYLTVDISEEDRISVRVSRDQVAKADVGDVVRFRKPRSKREPVHRLIRLYSDPALLPLPRRADEEE